MRIDLRWSLMAAALGLAACGRKDASSTAAPASAAPAASIGGAPAGGWTEQIVMTPEGGFRIGNPAAPVKLIEYGSLTCPHCAEFSAESAPALIPRYVASGRVSYEYRNFIREGFDLTAALVARCGGPAPFFKIVEQLYATQQDWEGKVVALPTAERNRLQALPTDQQGVAVAQASGLDEFLKQRGIGWDKAKACILDQKAQDKLIDMRQQAVDKFNVEGTPTFLINGQSVGSATWAALEPQLRGAGA